MQRLLLFIFLFISLNISAQTWDEQHVIVDTLPNFEYQFKPQRLILPVAMIGAGAWGIENGFMKKQKERIKDGMLDISGGRTTHLDNILRFGPAAMSVGLQYLGPESKLSQTEAVLTRLTAYGLMASMTYGTKKMVNEERPDGSDDESFPSGHCANSFMTAEMIRHEYGNAYGAVAYAMATGVGFLRMYNNKHWANDVLAGAGIGILSARMSYWLLPVEKKILRIKDNKRVQITIVPYYSSYGTSRNLGASMAMIF